MKEREKTREEETERVRERDQNGCCGFKAPVAAVASAMGLE